MCHILNNTHENRVWLTTLEYFLYFKSSPNIEFCDNFIALTDSIQMTCSLRTGTWKALQSSYSSHWQAPFPGSVLYWCRWLKQWAFFFIPFRYHVNVIGCQFSANIHCLCFGFFLDHFIKLRALPFWLWNYEVCIILVHWLLIYRMQTAWFRFWPEVLGRGHWSLAWSGEDDRCKFNWPIDICHWYFPWRYFVLQFMLTYFRPWKCWNTCTNVANVMQNSIRTALMDSLVWPSRIVVPMIPGGDFRYFSNDWLKSSYDWWILIHS